MSSIDDCYYKAYLLGKLAVDFPQEGVSIEVRVGRHLEGIKVLTETLGELESDKALAYSNIPDFEELNSHGIGFYLK